MTSASVSPAAEILKTHLIIHLVLTLRGAAVVFAAVSRYLSDVVLVQASLQPDPRLGLQVGDLFDDLQHVRHLFDGDHLLVPQAHPQVADAFDGRLDVRLLVRLHVDVTFDVIRGDDGLDLQRLLGGAATTVLKLYVINGRQQLPVSILTQQSSLYKTLSKDLWYD